MTLFVHRDTSTAALAEGLADLLATPLPDPFAEEVVAVPAKGVERWLAQRLSHTLGAGPSGHDGVCAGVRFLHPHSLVSMVLGIERDDPWHPDRLVWPVLESIDASLDEEWAGTLATHLGHGLTEPAARLRRGRRYAVARRLAGLFAAYASSRPAMLTDWRGDGDGDGIGGRVDPDLAWQPPLWREVLRRVDAEPPDVRHDRVVRALRAAPEDLTEDGAAGVPQLDLPGRLSLFGHTRIARSEVEVIAAIAQRRDVHLWLPQASPAAWDALAGTAPGGPVPREEDTSALLVEHPLLASLGRDARELQRTLALAPHTPGERHPRTAPAGAGPAHVETRTPSTPSILQLLQADLEADHVPTDAERAARHVPAADRSIQVHACHGRSRQVEVLRDVLTDLLEHDPTLEPRDILVMCPDIDTYAPLVHAGFGLGEVVRETGPGGAVPATHPAHTLRVRLADRSPTVANPLLALAAGLVGLAGGRLGAGEVLDLARSAAVRRRFGLDDDDLERIGDWVGAVAIRWGLDDAHRGDYALPGLSQNTWESGLARVLVGAAVDGEELDHLGTTLGLDDLDSADLDLAGRMAELVARLGATLRALRRADTVGEWVKTLTDGVLGLADVAPSEAWQVTQLRRELDLVGAHAGPRSGDGPGLSLSLSDVHALLDEHAAGRATRSNFRTGTLTVCTMVPMRSVPHRVVALVGLDDGVFPRTTAPDGDDATARRPVTGERDPRSEDRQLLLDAVMAAGDALVITYTGFDEHTGAPRPPAVPLGELLDAVRRTADPSSPGVLRVLAHHPLQPFDPRNLGAARPGAPALLPGGGPFSYDPAALAGGRAAVSHRAPRPRPVDPALEPLPGDTVELDALLRFFDHPARAYLRDRLGLVLPEVPEEQGEGIPIDLGGLQKWAVGDRVLQAVLAGRDPGATVDAELWRGELPPRALGAGVLREITEQAQIVAEATWRTAGRGGWGLPLERETLDVDLVLPSGTRLTGTLTGLVGTRVVTATYSTVRAKQRLRSWITSLVLAAALGPEATSHLLGAQKRGRRPGGVHLTHGPHDPGRALELLDQLVDLRSRGLVEPLPLPPRTALTWAEAYLRGPGDAQAATLDAVREWRTDDTFETAFPKEQDDPSHAYVHGDGVPLRDILGVPRDDERWTPGVGHRLGQLALRVWGPVLTDGAERKERL
ncbi:exodeoxyribonuclease V subunit gamma [uncultured Serinicoccus sp.]|uniref:exodeoxyribonuclease V subunit gamma n=1 Tax=uncultured Serinicoccus sp. TaxID=735514 RepID=UPI0026209CC0|nr:exodeoxyribonuclease V subunit gamma [uncultured Serinicoccus sp.]